MGLKLNISDRVEKDGRNLIYLQPTLTTLHGEEIFIGLGSGFKIQLILQTLII